MAVCRFVWFLSVQWTVWVKRMRTHCELEYSGTASYCTQANVLEVGIAVQKVQYLA